MPRRRGKASPLDPTPSPKDRAGAGPRPSFLTSTRRLGASATERLARSVRYRTALRPEKLDAKALRCRDAQERLPKPSPTPSLRSTREKPDTSSLISTRRRGDSASTSTSHSRWPGGQSETPVAQMPTRLPHPTQPLHRKTFRGKTSPLISHIHSAARRLSVYLHVSASRPSKPSAACTGRAVPDRLSLDRLRPLGE